MLRRGLLLVLVACREAPPETRPPSSMILVGGVNDAGALANAAPAVLTPPPPSEVACTFAPKDVQLSLAFSGEGPRFASIRAASGTLSVAIGAPSNGAFLEHAAEGVHLRGWQPSTDLVLYAKRPVLLSGWLVPRSATKLRWTDGRPGALELGLDDDLRDSRLTTVTFHQPPRGYVPCEGIALTYENEFDGVQFVTNGFTGTSQYVRAGEPIPLYTSSDLPPVADLQFSYADTAEVTVIRRHLTWALVVVDAWGPGTLRAWIPDAFFTTPPGRLVGGQHTRAPTLRMGTKDERDRRTVSCDRPVRIVAELAGRRAYAGEIEAATPFVFVIDGRRDGYRELALDNVYFAKDARLVADRAVLDACRITPR